MAVETSGTVMMRGDSDPGVAVRIRAGEGRLTLSSGEEAVGDWRLEDIGVHAVPDGFAIRAEGEEFVLRTSDDVALADELGLATATPRLARRVAASHNPKVPSEPVVVAEPSSDNRHIAAIAFALGGAMIILGGAFLRTSPEFARESLVTTTDGGAEFWLWFVVGGVLMVASAWVLSIGVRGSRLIALLVLAALIALFGFVASRAIIDPSYLTAYGFITGGVVVGVAVLSAGSLRDND